ncbi:MAG: response regulator [Gemmataceae bacterium]|nr:response regulator [Gemmataceae bacterium]
MPKILVVDDSALSRRISRRVLESGGHEVVEAHDGMAALEQYFLVKPDLVVLDITMKGMSGIDVLTQLRELDPRASVVIATADIQTSTRTLTQDAGARGFITKPLVPEQLLQAVSAALQEVH